MDSDRFVAPMRQPPLLFTQSLNTNVVFFHLQNELSHWVQKCVFTIPVCDAYAVLILLFLFQKPLYLSRTNGKKIVFVLLTPSVRAHTCRRASINDKYARCRGAPHRCRWLILYAYTGVPHVIMNHPCFSIRFYLCRILKKKIDSITTFFLGISPRDKYYSVLTIFEIKNWKTPF